MGQRRGMVGHMLADEARDEIIAVVVSGPLMKDQRMSRRLASRLQEVRPQLAVDKLIIEALVNKQR